MSGTINLALSQQFDADGIPLAGGRLFFFAAGTSTPQNSFQDIALTIVHPNPIILDSVGRVPMFYLDDGNIKIRLEDDGGLTMFAADNLLVIGPSGGGGGGGGVDPTTVMDTGDIKARFGTGALTGFARCNGNTIGSSASSASELADATAEQLFKYLWTTPLAIFTSAGGASTKDTANNDWTANKRMALPDLRGRTIAGLDTMGASAASRLTSTYWGASGATLGNAGGSEQKTLAEANMAAHQHSGTTATENQNHYHNFSGTTDNDGAHQHDYTRFDPQNGTAAGGNPPGGTTSTQNTFGNNGSHTHNFSGYTDNQSVDHDHDFLTDAGTGGGIPIATATPSMVMTYYIKL